MVKAIVLMKNNEVTILENVDKAYIEELKGLEENMNFILCEETIDWDYGY